ncbi:MAG: hypothetical protein AAF676_06710 [Pseudomonadota bacterium]
MGAFLFDPSRAEHVSVHAVVSDAAAAALKQTLGEGQAFATSGPVLPGVERSYDGFRVAAEEIAESRVWDGASFRFASEGGLALGEDAARWALAAFARDEDASPPRLLLDLNGGSPAVGREGVALTGAALDGLSGLAGLTASVDGAAGQPVSVAADGAFSLPVEGLGDGTYEVRFDAVDAEGAAASCAVEVVLDAAAPTIELTSFGDGAALSPGARLTGSADGTGSNLASLAWSVNGGPARALPAGAGAVSFDRALDLSGL